jgi:hypothetical protein
MPESIRVKRDTVLETLRKNKELHHAEYEEAIEGWIQKAKNKLNTLIEQLNSDNAREVKFELYLPKPESFEKEYEKALKMLELEIRDEIDITKQEFDKFFLDDWDWKDNFLSNTTMYKRR